MMEYLKKDKSFWFPFLDILPNPDPTCLWDDSDIEKFEDRYI